MKNNNLKLIKIDKTKKLFNYEKSFNKRINFRFNLRIF